MSVLTVLLVALPLVGCLAVLGVPERRAVWFGVAVSGVTLSVAVVIAAGFDYHRTGSVQDSVDWSWVPAIGLRFHLGVDGISLPLVVLTALLVALCGIYTTRPAGEP